jgi:class 3 adenylate cyclase
VPRTALCPVLIRRDDELGVLEDALLAARRGDSRFVAVAGEAGIGKTRLARELAGEARELGCTVLAGACSDAELTLPYLPFVEAIGNYLDEADPNRLSEALGPGLAELGQLFPQLARGAAPEQSPDQAQAKLRLFEALVSLLALPAREHTLLLVIEDVHWADASTRELLDYLARRLTDLPSLILVTYRRDELNRRHPLMPVLQGWRRSGVADVIELEPLSADGVGEMLAAILGEGGVDAELRELMVERSEGKHLVTSLFADVRGYAELGGSIPPKALAERMAMLYRLARVAVERRQGIVDKFAGDAVMATFNVSGTSTDHSVEALDAALALRDRAAAIELPLGIGISVGAGLVGRGASDDNLAVTGEATNLAARLQAQAGPGEILLSAEAHRRVAGWLENHGLQTVEEELELKGFSGPQVVHRIPAGRAAEVASR